MDLSKTGLFNRLSTSYSQFLNAKRSFHELGNRAEACLDGEFFRRSISLHYQHLYAKKKWQNWIHRLTFFVLSLLFNLFGVLIYFKSTNYNCELYFGDCSAWKNSVNAACFFLAAAAYFLGYFIKPEKEAIRFLVSKVAKDLNGPVKQLQVEFRSLFSRLSQDQLSHLETLEIDRS